MAGSQSAPRNSDAPVNGNAPADEGTPAGAPETYERARAELENVVRRLEAGGITLEESLTLWERGEELARVCQSFLDGARARLDSGAQGRVVPPTD